MFCPGKWVMVKQESGPEKSAGGIIIPEKHRSKHAPARGTIVCAGVDCTHVRDQDEVLFSKENAFTDEIPDGEGGTTTYVFVEEKDICVVTNR